MHFSPDLHAYKLLKLQTDYSLAAEITLWCKDAGPCLVPANSFSAPELVRNDLSGFKIKWEPLYICPDKLYYFIFATSTKRA